MESQGELKPFERLVQSAYTCKRSECSDIQFSRDLAERIRTRRTEEYRRSVCEDLKYDLKILLHVLSLCSYLRSVKFTVTLYHH
jgi:hypothetical protein